MAGVIAVSEVQVTYVERYKWCCGNNGALPTPAYANGPQ